MKGTIESLRRFKDHPFMRLDSDRIQVRAYYHWLNKTSESPNDPFLNWVKAELEETAYLGSLQFRIAYDPQCPENNSLLFDAEYELLSKVEYPDEVAFQKKLNFGTKSPRHCSICQKSEPEVTFKKKAHLIPESLGNKWIITYDECDICNEKYGKKYENELGKMLQVEKAMYRVPIKGSGTAKLKLADGRSSLGGQGRYEPLRIELREGDDAIELVNFTDHEVQMKMQSPSYRPYFAIKSIAKSVWQLLPIDFRSQFESFRLWIKEEYPFFPITFYYLFLPGPGRPFSGLAIWKKLDKDKYLPELLSMLHFGNIAILWPLPDFDKQTMPPILLPPMPISPFPPHTATVRKFVIKSDGLAKPKASDVTFFFMRKALRYTKDPIAIRLISKDSDGTSISLNSFLTIPTDAAEHEEAYSISGGQFAGELRLRIGINEEKGNAGYSLELPDYPAADALLTCEFLKSVEKGVEVEVVDIGRNEPLFAGRLHSPVNEVLAPLLENSKRIVRIADEFGVDLRYPVESQLSQLSDISVLSDAIELGAFKFPPPNGLVDFSFDGRQKHFLDQLIKLLNNKANNIHFARREEFTINDIVIDAGICHYVFEGAEIPGNLNIEDLMREPWTEEEIRVVTIPCKTVHRYFENWTELRPNVSNGDG